MRRFALATSKWRVSAAKLEPLRRMRNLFRHFQTHFPNSFQRYSMLEKERLFLFEPKFIERWLYENGIPYVEQFDICSQHYSMTLYSGK